MSGVTLSGTDPELLNKLHQHFVLHSIKLREVVEKYGDGVMYFKIIQRKPEKLIITRAYYDDAGYLGKYDSYTIENWFNEIKCENPFYIYINLFGNGISFTIIEDAYWIMEE